MNLCCKCLQAIGLTVPHPQILLPEDFCDGCEKPKKSLSVMQVTLQLLVEKKVK